MDPLREGEVDEDKFALSLVCNSLVVCSNKVLRDHRHSLLMHATLLQQYMGIPCSEQRLEKLFRASDTDGSGNVTV